MILGLTISLRAFLLWVLGVTLLFLVFWLRYYKINPLKLLKPDVVDEPIISARQMLATNSLKSMATGTMEGYQYNLLTDKTGRVMLFVQLGRNSKLHFIALGDKSKFSGEATNNNYLKPLELEGDFPDYFKLYCTPDEAFKFTELFDPADMAYFADFCRSYDFEVFDDSIYIAQAEQANDSNDSTPLVKDAEAFLKRNKKFLERL